VQARRSRVESHEAAPDTASEELMTLRAILDAERTAHEQQLVEVRLVTVVLDANNCSCEHNYNGVTFVAG
jgi:hypothetical protein